MFRRIMTHLFFAVLLLTQGASSTDSPNSWTTLTHWLSQPSEIIESPSKQTVLGLCTTTTGALVLLGAGNSTLNKAFGPVGWFLFILGQYTLANSESTNPVIKDSSSFFLKSLFSSYTMSIFGPSLSQSTNTLFGFFGYTYTKA